jgi:hypothetical protein
MSGRFGASRSKKSKATSRKIRFFDYAPVHEFEVEHEMTPIQQSLQRQALKRQMYRRPFASRKAAVAKAKSRRLGVYTTDESIELVSNYLDVIPKVLVAPVIDLITGQRKIRHQFLPSYYQPRLRDIREYVAATESRGPKLAKAIASLILLG